MKLRVISLFLIIISYACSTRENFKVKGKILNAEGEKLILKELTINDVVPIDSTVLSENGKFVLKGFNNRIAFYSLTLGKNNSITLVIKPGDKIHISANAKDFRNSYEIEGSEESELVKELTNQINFVHLRVDSLNRIYQDSLGTPNILKTKHYLDSLFKIIESDQIGYTEKFIKQNRGKLVTVMALYQQITPKRALLNPAEHYHLFKEVDSIMMLTYPEADAVKSLHQLLERVNDEYLRKLAVEKRTAVGAYMPDISLPDYNNKTISLASLKGKYVLVDFWASWCQPCRELNKTLVGIYWRYRNAGFEIYQVSLDKSREAWLKAITDDGLPWINVSDLKMWDSPFVALFGIESIPFSILVDKEGKIILKNPSKEELSNKLKEIFKY